MDSVTRTAIKNEALRRGWKFEQFFNDETFYKITNDKGEWRLGRGSRLGFSDANGVVIARDKLRTYEFIETLGVRLAPYKEIKNSSDAMEFIALHGSIVIKPRDNEQGQGVSVGVNTEEKALAAIRLARKHSAKGVIAQPQLQGNLYRILVVGDQMVAAVRRRAAFVEGDGVHTIDELIDIKNRDPRRSKALDGILKPINRKVALAHVGEDRLRSIVPVGEVVEVDPIAGVSRGGESENVSEQVPDSLKKVLTKIVGHLKLSICGFDIIISDLSALDSVGFLPLLEINSMPGLKGHLFPTAGGAPVNPAPFILDQAFHPNST